MIYVFSERSYATRHEAEAAKAHADDLRTRSLALEAEAQRLDRELEDTYGWCNEHAEIREAEPGISVRRTLGHAFVSIDGITVGNGKFEIFDSGHFTPYCSIDEEHRRKGYGLALLKDHIARGEALGFKMMWGDDPDHPWGRGSFTPQAQGFVDHYLSHLITD